MSDSAAHQATPASSPVVSSARGRGARSTSGRVVLATVLLSVGVIVAAFLSDTVAAVRAEHSLARALLSSPTLSYEPEVTLRGFPFLTHASDGSFDGALITARGVPVAGCEYGDCHAELGADIDSLDVADGWSFDPDDKLGIGSMQTYTRLDSVNLGRMMGIIDLSVNTPGPEDVAGAGGPGDGLLNRSSGVLLTGTVPLGPVVGDAGVPVSAQSYPGPRVKVSVVVDLDVVDGRMRLRATDFYRGPEEHVAAEVADEDRAAILDRFSMTLPSLPAPFGVAADEAYSAGSDVVIAGRTGPREVTPRTF